jgi:hypothetical protein
VKTTGSLYFRRSSILRRFRGLISNNYHLISQL